jgi:hypothetical protein
MPHCGVSGRTIQGENPRAGSEQKEAKETKGKEKGNQQKDAKNAKVGFAHR